MHEKSLEIAVEALKSMKFDGDVINVKSFGSGIINDTFLVTCKNNKGNENKYILQKINSSIFKNVEKLMENYCGVCDYLKKIVSENGGDVERETITVVPTNSGKSYLKDSLDNYWRAIKFISDTVTYDVAESAEDFYKVGKAFGEFQNKLAGYNAENLYESIPNFHNTKERFKTFLLAIENNKARRLESVRSEVDFILEREKDTSILLDLYENGELPLRVTHNDTKISNILMDANTKNGICIIDLDTIMPGLSLYDFGDAIRSGATHALEDEKDLDKVYVDLEFFEAFTKGFLEGTNSSLTEKEIEMLPMGAKVITLEQAIRFLTDYLDGDVYYKTSYSNQNLDRTRTQLKLVKDIEEKWNELNNIVNKYVSNSMV
ncbi:MULTISPECIES: aminoglycoside phosphotransferase family protein [unclassified Clostridium]|uniref:phosphotransferase enzyme family protein n=1 Tax=Clostridium TaxID=1485 RepID=UPI001C8BE992|nr:MULTISPECIES: aminoglycoside phosphotransferase family protein [unclassified Clostridium]MBX9139225.1 aminoglycoside phosphotransferase family protein [Clostridium sp. K12(2020)]MBX9145878.1 aminoglycoside phosphotransferase family protein [Clostridium sp. K13]MDU2291659.1 aminoglycoside phosphotransferase family protein [Clostridium celatum]MDU4325935.1 aminoglycoside phosphotransferase family protein [Clostridium celatum]